MKTTKLKFTAIFLIMTLLLTVAGCSSTAEPIIEPIEEADTSEVIETPTEKFVGSKSLMVSLLGFYTLDDFMLYSDKIVIGKIESAEVDEESIPISDELTLDGEPLPPLIFDVTKYNVIVSETLWGEHSDTITLALAGTPDSDEGMTKPKIGDKVLLILGENVEGIFTPLSFEMGIFIINDDDTMYSLSDDELTAQFDGVPLEELEEEIVNVLDEGEYSEEFLACFIEEYQEELIEELEQSRQRRSRGQHGHGQGRGNGRR